ncbi:hypothetical protein B0T10DRAFT_466369 [Thelonectria olida]|uniref:Uncharacterized protein n=1 Tax=Thelonectria olida TaxID=1576542 RepID=A0A9P8VU17_9HYPO|nr:hypothetical protein B0T10DRAFT_466369 [Thelonectria olida]
MNKTRHTACASIEITTDQRLSQAASDGESVFKRGHAVRVRLQPHAASRGRPVLRRLRHQRCFPPPILRVRPGAEGGPLRMPVGVVPSRLPGNRSAVYNYEDDGSATHGCDSDTSLTLFLCQEG